MKVTIEIDDFSIKALYDALIAMGFAGCKNYETLFERILNDTVFRLDDFIENAMKGMIYLGYSREDTISRFPGTNKKLSERYDTISRSIDQKRLVEWKERQKKSQETSLEPSKPTEEPPKPKEDVGEWLKRKMQPKDKDEKEDKQS